MCFCEQGHTDTHHHTLTKLKPKLYCDGILGILLTDSSRFHLRSPLNREDRTAKTEECACGGGGGGRQARTVSSVPVVSLVAA